MDVIEPSNASRARRGAPGMMISAMRERLEMLQMIVRANSAYREKWISAQLHRIPPGNLILDAGCGGQPYRKDCSHLRYMSQDSAQLDAKLQIIGGAYGQIDVISDITKIPLPDSTFDAVLCTEVLEHVPDPVVAVFELSRLLKPGGTLLLTAPLCSFEHQEPYHFYGGFSRYWYQRVLAAAGLRDIRVEPNGGYFRFFGQECQRIVRLLFRGRPFTSPMRWLMLPIELVSVALLTVAAPIICHFLDKKLRTPGLTLGYHVVATKG